MSCQEKSYVNKPKAACLLQTELKTSDNAYNAHSDQLTLTDSITAPDILIEN